jgi:hypothetical protein
MVRGLVGTGALSEGDFDAIIEIERERIARMRRELAEAARTTGTMMTAAVSVLPGAGPVVAANDILERPSDWKSYVGAGLAALGITIALADDAGRLTNVGGKAEDRAGLAAYAGKGTGPNFTREMLSRSVRIAGPREITKEKMDKLIELFGGSRSGWVKKKGTDASGEEWHWYEHHGIGRRGIKRKGECDPF